MKKKTLGAFCCACLLFLSAPEAAEASWYWIHPGDHVFDAKRFADSIKETAETVKNVMQTLDKAQNRLKMLAQAGDIEGMWTCLETMGSLPEGKTAAEYTQRDRSVWETAGKNEPYWPILHASQAQSNQDTGKAAETLFTNEQRRQETLRNLTAQQDEGLLSEDQRLNAREALGALSRIDAAELLVSQSQQDISEQEAVASSQRVEQEKAKAGAFYGYDPYHPNEYDQEKRVVKTHSLGFMKYGGD